MAEGYKDFTAGSGLAAADLEDYCELQSVMRFASAAARDSALSSVKTEGMVAYLKDVNTLTVYTGTGTTWSTIATGHGALATWTPVITQGSTVTATINNSWVARNGRNFTAGFTATCTGAGTGGQPITVSAPVAASGLTGGFELVGTCEVYDLSATTAYDCKLYLTSSTVAGTYYLGAGSHANLAASIAITLASGDILTGRFDFQASADA